jgi:hypothetical protein
MPIQPLEETVEHAKEPADREDETTTNGKRLSSVPPKNHYWDRAVARLGAASISN